MHITITARLGDGTLVACGFEAELDWKPFHMRDTAKADALPHEIVGYQFANDQGSLTWPVYLSGSGD